MNKNIAEILETVDVRESAAFSSFVENTPKGRSKLTEFLGAVKDLHAALLPGELRDAMGEFVAVLENGLDGMKYGCDLTKYDEPMAAAKVRLDAAFRTLHSENMGDVL